MTHEEVQRLEKAELDLAVARAMGMKIHEKPDLNYVLLIEDIDLGVPLHSYYYIPLGELARMPIMQRFSPSTNWAQGGPLIEELISEYDYIFSHDCWGKWNVHADYVEGDPGDYITEGSTLLEAACRAYVLAKGE